MGHRSRGRKTKKETGEKRKKRVLAKVVKAVKEKKPGEKNV